jgi:hypothetical protein
MRNVFRLVLIMVVGFAMTVASGCASKQVKPTYSGFLEEYPDFQPGPEGGADLVYLKEGVDFSVYKRVMIDRVVFFFRDDAKYKGIHADELQALSGAFHREMAYALRGAGAYPSAEEPAPDVLRIRFAITDVVQSKPSLQAFSFIMPPALVASSIKKSQEGSHIGVGQASMEAELIDSMTNERIGAVIDTKAAGQFELTDKRTTWEHTKNAFRFWAQRLRKWLDEVHGR